MSRPTERAEIVDGALRLADRRVPLLSGEVHFFRTDPGHWDRILARMVEAGIPVVATYISWRRHELVPGRLDFTGVRDPRLDVQRFVDRCAAHGLLVHLKPGPWICAEEDRGGLPDWLLDDRELWALDADGQPILGYNPPWQHPVPSYLHPRYLRHARRWLRAVDRHLANAFYPHGPIVLVQLDNEPSYGFRDSMYGFDYHRVTIDRYRRWLLRRYRTLEAIEASWGRALSSPDALDPPRRPTTTGSAREELDWIEFREWMIAEYLSRLRNCHESAGVNHVVFTANYNEHPVATAPQDGWRIARAIGGTGGADLYYEPPIRPPDLDRLARMVGVSRAQDPHLAWAPEIQAGIWRTPGDPTPDPTAEEQELWWLAALAFGLRGLNLYMLADRERWAMAPLGGDGTPGRLWPAVVRLAQLIRTIPEWGRLRPVTPVALYLQANDVREAYRLLGPTRRQATRRSWADDYSELLRGGYLPAVWDARARRPPEVAGVVVPRPDLLAPKEHRRFERFAADRGPVVYIQGDAEHLAQRLHLTTPGRAIITAPSIGHALDELGRRGVVPPVTVDDPTVRAFLAQSPEVDVLFLISARPVAKVVARVEGESYRGIRAMRGGDPGKLDRKGRILVRLDDRVAVYLLNVAR